MAAETITVYVAPTGYVYHRDRNCYQLGRAKTVKRARVSLSDPGAQVEHADYGTRYSCGVCAS